MQGFKIKPEKAEEETAGRECASSPGNKHTKPPMSSKIKAFQITTPVHISFYFKLHTALARQTHQSLPSELQALTRWL